METFMKYLGYDFKVRPAVVEDGDTWIETHTHGRSHIPANVEMALATFRVESSHERKQEAWCRFADTGQEFRLQLPASFPLRPGHRLMTVVASRNGRWWIVYLKNLNMNELRMMAGAADLQPLWGLLGRASVYGLVGAIPALFVAIGLKSTVLALAARKPNGPRIPRPTGRMTRRRARIRKNPGKCP
jgi:hypothetical protein